jgi:hypothetical protein
MVVWESPADLSRGDLDLGCSQMAYRKVWWSRGTRSAVTWNGERIEAHTCPQEEGSLKCGHVYDRCVKIIEIMRWGNGH